MTWLLLAFTGWAVTITNQYQEPHCVAHAVATCGSLYWYDSNPETYVKKLWIWEWWYNVRLLPNSLYNMNLSRPRVYDREGAKKLLSKWPVVLDVNRTLVDIWWLEVTRHAMCAVWYDDNYIYVANSRGTGRWIQWYGMIASWDIQFVTLQTLWSKTLTPSLITLTEKKEDLQESKQTVKSPTIKKRSTKKRFLTPLD